MFPIDFCHIPVSIIKRSAGRSAVAAAAYRSGTKLTNEWDGMTHDYTRKGGIVHAEIMLPAHAPPEFADRSILWNSVERIEKARDSQLAREIEAALPRELSGEQQLALVRAYVKEYQLSGQQYLHCPRISLPVQDQLPHCRYHLLYGIPETSILLRPSRSTSGEGYVRSV